ncbi:MAG: hypothetical protein KDA88_17975 [Planctomycetaceae bacterium]|nr:hypothetical protein [Planctomycetaceae bacterium]MCB9952013.1 hypothetical protein [Planctomycetaceae bacterium]
MSDDNSVDWSDKKLWDAFLAASISEEQWTHRAHVRVGYLFVSRYGFTEALTRMRDGIQALNRALGTPEAIDRGYHETITRAFLHLISAAKANWTGESSNGFCDAHPELMAKRVLLDYYSRDCIMSAEAKAEFVDPDIQPLPELAE